MTDSSPETWLEPNQLPLYPDFPRNGIFLDHFGRAHEAVWGANPLEAYGGFSSLPIDYAANLHSPLGIDGTVKWSIVDDVFIDDHSGDGEVSWVELNIAFPVVDWAFQQSVYGWAAFQYQAFARGSITVTGHFSCRVALYTDHVLEFAVNDEPSFGGDFYGFRRAPLIVDLVPGKNKIELRLIRDVRSMGGVGPPSIPVRLGAQLCTAVLKVVEESAVLPDVINTKLITPYGSIIVRNETKEWIKLVAIRCRTDSPTVSLLNSSASSLAPGQSRPVGLWFNSRCLDIVEGVNIALVYNKSGQHKDQSTAFFKLKFRQRLIHEPHRFTFLHPSGAVSYAILRPPRVKVAESIFPVLLNLHGAGLQADSHQVSHMLDAVPDLNAWVLFPTGMSPWCGDDWHGWALADVNAAVSAIPGWIKNMGWTGPGVDINKWIVTGHSNGGQGSWFISSHHPDRVVATAAVSGYSSIQNYVPYIMWAEGHPLVNATVQNSLSSYRHEQLVGNLPGTRIFQQHGAKDDNVPPYHSRLMHSLLAASGSSPEYVELPEQGHWFEGAMTTPALQAFYSSVLSTETFGKQFPMDFEFIVPNSGDVGSRAGIFVDQLDSPDTFGRLSVHRDEKDHIWHIKTSNIHRMHFCFQVSDVQQPEVISLDETLIHVPPTCEQNGELTLVQCDDRWIVCDNHNWKILSARFGRQRGCLDAILSTQSLFKIQVCSESALGAALQVSRNLAQYYGADAEITSSGVEEPGTSAAGNVITLVVGEAVKLARLSNFPIQISADGIQIRRPNDIRVKRIPFRPGLGAVFLRPLPDENLELVLWGSDKIGLGQAVRMVPTLTGAGQPDFIILGNEARWKGHGGALAMGFFDHAWQVSQASYTS